MIHYQGSPGNEGLNLSIDRMKSPVEYVTYTQQTNSNSVVTTMSTNTPAEAKFAQIAPLLSQGMLHRQHNPNMEHQSITHSQSVVMDDRLLMTAPPAHHRKEEHPHEYVLRRAPGVVQQHSTQQQHSSVISNTAALNTSIEEPQTEDYRDRRPSLERIHRATSVEIVREAAPEKHTVEEQMQTSPYSSKYRYTNDGCFQTVLQVS